MNYLKFVALHEFGDAIGLDDITFGCAPETSVMVAPKAATLHPLVPTENDKAALRKLLKIK